MVLWGVARRYYAPRWAGPLSVKSVRTGRAVWTTDEARHEIGEESYLVVNESHPYTIEIEALEPVETFCVFFAPGFIDDARNQTPHHERALLDEPFREAGPTHFQEALQPRHGSVGSLLTQLQTLIRSPKSGAVKGEEDILVRLAQALCRERDSVAGQHRRISAAKAATRDEVLRRVCVARDLIDSTLDESLRLQDLARVACMSPFHLHRHFRTTFGETPQEYRSRRRMERAARALRSTDAPVTEIALDAGFSSLGSFSSLFKRQFGASPREFRRRS